MTHKPQTPSILVFGGTFDPIHLGHLHVALNIQKNFHFDRFIFLPCKDPVLKKKPETTPAQRVTMLQLALAEHPEAGFEVDLREIQRETESYMVTTLMDYREELGLETSIALLMGSDAFATLPRWQQWEKLLSLSNLLIMERERANDNFSNLLIQVLKAHETFEKSELLAHPFGQIYRYNAGNFNIASTSLRAQLHSGHSLEQLPIPESVKQYIAENKLYL